MRIDTLIISLFLLTLGTIGCSQPEAVKAEYEPANCDCIKQTTTADAPPAQTEELAHSDEQADEPTQPVTTIAQFKDPVVAGSDLAGPEEQEHPAANTEVSPKSDPKSNKPDPNGVVNLNTASLNQLMALPGVGPALAARIVEFREKRQFEQAQHLLRVRGIGKATFAKLAPMLAVSGQTTLAK
jgi:competence protein ComEA